MTSNVNPVVEEPEEASDIGNLDEFATNLAEQINESKGWITMKQRQVDKGRLHADDKVAPHFDHSASQMSLFRNGCGNGSGGYEEEHHSESG